MEKAVLIELLPNGIKMTTERLMGGAFHKKIEENNDMIRFDEDIFGTKEISSDKMEDCINLLLNYKVLANLKGISKIFAYASSIFYKATNMKPFFDGIFKRTGIFFNVLTEEEEMRMIYNAVIGTLDTVKGILVYVNYHNTYVMNFAKRSLMTSYVLPFGSNSLSYQFKDLGTTKRIMTAMQKYIKSAINDKNITFENFEELRFVGAGPMFLAMSKFARKLLHYPVSRDDNFYVSKENIDNAFEVLLEQGFDSKKRLTNITSERLDNFMSGVAIMKVFAEAKNVDYFNITERGVTDSIMSHKIVRENSCDGTPNDPMELSIKNISYYFPIEDSNAEHVFHIANDLFQQMSIIHKLSRKHLKPLKIAALMYDCGKRVSPVNHAQFSKDIILNSGIVNVSHHDLVVAAFACKYQNYENFNLAEWIQYRDVVDEEDLVAARRIGILLALANALDASKQGKIKEISCDLLGDIVIIKAKAEGDINYEISEANKLLGVFKKVFKKNFHVM